MLVPPMSGAVVPLLVAVFVCAPLCCFASCCLMSTVTGSKVLPGASSSAMNASQRCELPMSRGNCKAAVNRFYYDSATKACQPFTYGGCGGNGNNFGTKESCEALCQK